MALAMKSPGSGEFVPVRDWTCTEHDSPRYHECDCEFCAVGEWECATCATAEWVPRMDENGEPVMRELAVFEQMMREMAIRQLREFAKPSLLLSELRKPGRVEWQEDALVPIHKAPDA